MNSSPTSNAKAASPSLHSVKLQSHQSHQSQQGERIYECKLWTKPATNVLTARLA